MIFRKGPTKTAVIFISDTHINATMGLSSRDVVNSDGNHIGLNKVQNWLNSTWWKSVDEINDYTNGYKKVVVFVGDIIDIDAKSRTWQLMSNDPEVAIENAMNLVKPFISQAEHTFVVVGTGAHVGTDGWLEKSFGERIGAEINPDTEKRSWLHLRAQFNKTTFDIAHHTSMGRLPWSFANAANKLSVITEMEYNDWGEPLPDYALRGHNHRFTDSSRAYRIKSILLPSWEFHTTYTHRIGAGNAKPSIGSVVVKCEDDGTSTWKEFIYEPKRSKVWKETN